MLVTRFFSRSDGSGKGARRSMTLNVLRHEFWRSYLKLYSRYTLDI